MRGRDRRKIETGTRSAAFNRANPSTDAAHEIIVSRLEDDLALADALGIRQHEGLSEAHAASVRRALAKLEIESAYIAPLVKVGRLAEQDAPELLGKFRISRSNTTHKSFSLNARSMLTQALAAKDVLLSHGLPATLPDGMAKALDRFDAEGLAISNSRESHIQARVKLGDVCNRIIDLVDALDGFNRYRYLNDPDKLAAWNAARSVVAHSARKSTTITPPAPPTAPDGSTKVA